MEHERRGKGDTVLCIGAFRTETEKIEEDGGRADRYVECREGEEKRDTRGGSNCEVINIGVVIPFSRSIGRGCSRASALL